MLLMFSLWLKNFYMSIFNNIHYFFQRLIRSLFSLDIQNKLIYVGFLLINTKYLNFFKYNSLLRDSYAAQYNKKSMGLLQL